jgi:TrmH family RNA methyltransferase
MEISQISSGNIKLASSLSLKKYRDQSGRFLIEGEKCVNELLASDLKIDFLVVSDNYKNAEDLLDIANKQKIHIYLADQHSLKKMSDAKTPQGVISVARIPKTGLALNNSFIYLESIADPGNLGTIIRTADWFGVKNILLSNDSVDCYNPKVVRSAMGSLFRINIEYSEDPLPFIQKNFQNVPCFAADINSPNDIKQISAPKIFGLLFGSEARGFSELTLDKVGNTFRIQGGMTTESLNLSISVGISLFYFVGTH